MSRMADTFTVLVLLGFRSCNNTGSAPAEWIRANVSGFMVCSTRFSSSTAASSRYLVYQYLAFSGLLRLVFVILPSFHQTAPPSSPSGLSSIPIIFSLIAMFGLILITAATSSGYCSSQQQCQGTAGGGAHQYHFVSQLFADGKGFLSVFPEALRSHFFKRFGGIYSMLVQTGEIKVIAVQRRKIAVNGVALLFAGGEAMQVNHAVRRFLAYCPRPYNTGLIFRPEAILGLLLINIGLQPHRLIRHTGQGSAQHRRRGFRAEEINDGQRSYNDKSGFYDAAHRVGF